MSDSFYIALAGTVGAFFAMIPAGILAYATLVKVKQLRQDTKDLTVKMNGHMTKVLEVTAAKGLAEGELKGRSDRSAEYLTEKTRAEDREDALVYQEQLRTVILDPNASKATVADAQKAAKDAQATAKDAQSTAKNLTEEAT